MSDGVLVHAALALAYSRQLECGAHLVSGFVWGVVRAGRGLVSGGIM